MSTITAANQTMSSTQRRSRKMSLASPNSSNSARCNNPNVVAPVAPAPPIQRVPSANTQSSRSSSRASDPIRPSQAIDRSSKVIDRSSQVIRSSQAIEPIPLENDTEFDALLAKFLTVKSQPFAVSGRFPMDTRELTMFFRTAKGRSHCIDFPVDVDHLPSPTFNLLYETCRQHAEEWEQERQSPLRRFAEFTPASGRDLPKSSGSSHFSFPKELSLSTSLDLSNQPVLDTVRDILFPNMPSGHYLTATRAGLEIVPAGVRSRSTTSREHPSDAIAILLVTLPVRFQGGELVVTHPEDSLGTAERFRARGGKAGDIEWTAFLADCSYRWEQVTQGCRVSLVYHVCLKSFAPSQTIPRPYIVPNDRFLDVMTPLFTRARGRKLGFYLSGCYNLSPAEDLADTIIAQLKGSDAMLFNAVKLYNFKTEFRYTAGGYVWSAQHSIQLLPPSELPVSPPSSEGSDSVGRSRSVRSKSSRRRSQSRRRASNSDDDDDLVSVGRSFIDDGSQQSIQSQVIASGAISMTESGIFALTASTRRVQGPVTKLPISFISNGTLSRLWVNVLLVVSPL